MEIIGQLIQFIKEIFSWWFIVTPWEQAVFVRAGKISKVLKAGFYFKIPFIDQVYLQPIRLRTIDMPMQTISTNDSRTISVKAVLTYSIVDIYKLYNTISHPETTLTGIVMSQISEYIRSVHYCDIITSQMEKGIADKLSNNDYGLGDISVRITSWAEVKTIRLIQDQSFMYADQLDMSKLK